MKLLSPIQAFIFASAGIHVSLLVMSDSINLTLPGTTGSVMSVKLEEKTQEIAQHYPVKPQLRKINKVSKNIQTSKPLKKISEQTKEPQQQSSTSKQKNVISKAHVVSVIYKHLTEHFKYPRIAQRRNWEGKVLLAFHITRDGNIKNIKINHSSGYNVLDQAAMISLQKIGQLPQLSSWLSSGMEIQIPIIYQLTNS